MEHMEKKDRDSRFCEAFFRSLDPEAAGSEAGGDGFRLLRKQANRQRLERMRKETADQIRREDVVRRMAQLAFGRANDAVRLALDPQNVDIGSLDLSAVAEIKVGEKGVELKLTDRVRALEALHGLIEAGATEESANGLYAALTAAAQQMGEE